MDGDRRLLGRLRHKLRLSEGHLRKANAQQLCYLGIPTRTLVTLTMVLDDKKKQ